MGHYAVKHKPTLHRQGYVVQSRSADIATILILMEERLKELQEKFFSNEPMSIMEFEEMNDLAYELSQNK